MTDKRYQQLMEQCGMPNSRSLLQTLQQVEHETAIKYTTEIETLKADAERIDWLGNEIWDDDDLLALVDCWITKDGTHHPGGLRDAIDAEIKQQKETP